MEQTLRNRLTYGPIMLSSLLGLLLLDHFVEQWTRHAGILPPWGVGGAGLLLILMIVLPPATLELAELFTSERVRPYRLISVVGASSLGIHAFMTQFAWFREYATSILAFIVVSVMLAAALRRAWGRQTQEAIQRMAGTVLATMYLGGLAWFLLALRVKHSSHPGGFHGTTMVIVMILLTVKLTDVGAFFGGRTFGRHKLISWLSPGKTWEGLGFGVLTGGLIGMACAAWILNLRWHEAFIFGAVMGGVGQLGDLLESLMKRDAEVKDSGHLIPGFGGMLDVIDSPLLAAPFAYVLFSIW